MLGTRGDPTRRGVILTPSARGGRWVRSTLIVGVGLALGAGVVLAVGGGDDPAPTRANQGPSVTRFAFSDGALPPVIDPAGTDPGPTGPTEEPPDAEAALAAFLQSLVEAKPEVAYALLDSSGRSRFPTLEAWIRAQADLAAPTSFTIGPSRAAFDGGEDAVEVEVVATHRPSLDAVRGLVPGSSRSLWQIRRESAGWRVAAEALSVRPILPPDTAATDAVRSWVDRLAACDRDGAASLQVGSYLYGPSTLVDAPCEKRGGWTVGTAVTLDQATDSKDFLAAFGPAVGGWARLVPVEGSDLRFFAAVAPIGDTWRVMGVAVGD